MVFFANHMLIPVYFIALTVRQCEAAKKSVDIAI